MPQPSDSRSHWTLVAWQAAHLAGGGLMIMGMWLFLARHWGPARFGEFNVLFAFAAISGIVADFGLDVLVTRRTAGRRQRIGPTPARLKGAITLSAGVLFAVIAHIAGLPPLESLLLLGGAAALSLTGFLNGLLRGCGRLDLEAKLGLAQKASFSLGGIALVDGGAGITAVALLYLTSHLLTLAATALFAARHAVGLSPAPAEGLRGVLFETLPLWTAALLAATLGRIDLFLLEALRGGGEVGHFAAAWRLAEGAFIVATAYVTALFPRLVRAAHGEEPLTPVVMRAARLLGLAGVAAAAAGALLAPWLTGLLYGEEYAASAPLLRVLFATLPLLLLSGLFSHTLLAAGRAGPVIAALLAAIASNLLLDLWLVPLWGPMGAAAGLLGRELVLLALLTLTIHRSSAWPRAAS